MGIRCTNREDNMPDEKMLFEPKTGKRMPRNVTGYYVQDKPDGCWNCAHRYWGMVRDISNEPIVACELACKTPEKPSFCDEVDPFGKCDGWTGKRETPPNYPTPRSFLA